MLNCIVIDNEKSMPGLLVDHIKQVTFLNWVAACKNTMEAAEILHQEKVDLIFLDIEMPGLERLQFVQSLQRPPMFIFVSANENHAVQGITIGPVDHLVKPVSFDVFLKACNKALELYNLQQQSTTKEILPDYFFVYVGYNLVKVSIPDIIYIEGMKDAVKIVVQSSAKAITTKMSLKSLEEKLLPYRFVRAHKSYVVSIDKVTGIKRDLICLGPVELPLGESYRPNIENLLSL